MVTWHCGKKKAGQVNKVVKEHQNYYGSTEESREEPKKLKSKVLRAILIYLPIIKINLMAMRCGKKINSGQQLAVSGQNGG